MSSVTIRDLRDEIILQRRAAAQARGDIVSQKVNFQDEIFVTPGIPYFVHLSIGCGASSGTVGSSRCESEADPMFAFDQEAFDAISAEQGLPSFRLDDYYEFQFSPNMTGPSEPGPNPLPVSKPGTLSLLALSLLRALTRGRSLMSAKPDSPIRPRRMSWKCSSC